MEQQIVFQINLRDNVATALTEITIGTVALRGDSHVEVLDVVEPIPRGHKVALHDIASGEEIIKYGIVIGRSTQHILKGTWVHLHCMCSIYDERSSHLDSVTGVPLDTKYE